jgi:hypothetical protein
MFTRSADSGIQMAKEYHAIEIAAANDYRLAREARRQPTPTDRRRKSWLSLSRRPHQLSVSSR